MSQKDVLRGLGLAEDDAKKMISDIAFAFIAADQKKTVIKKPEILKTCDLFKKEKRVQDYIIAQAAKQMSDILGIELKELKNSYILTSRLEQESNHIEWSDKEYSRMALTYTILGLILMSNGKITDDILFKFLKSVGLYEDEKTAAKSGPKPSDCEIITAFYDGDTKKFINETLVTKQHYLRRESIKTLDMDAEVYEYSWGERAEHECKPSEVFRMVCDMYECDGQMFREQMDRIKEEERLDDDFFKFTQKRQH